ncbi:MAG TPA: HAD family hydrolase [Anaerolineae bacterium]|nr:HAD family hydrolase [Anaerolineae bacterium]
MLKAVLFDLDDTLLKTSTEAFLRRYFVTIGRYAAELMPPEKLLAELQYCTRMTIENVDTAVTNHDVFWQCFSTRNNLDIAETEAFFDQFYRREFPKMQSLTHPVPGASAVVQACLDAGLKVVIATNPLFPAFAIEERLRWAGVPAEEYPFALVTTMDNMHASKPNLAYYREILDMIEVEADTAVMVGDDWKRDILPAHAVGMHTYWIAPDDVQPPNADIPCGHGSLAHFYDSLKLSGAL